MTSLAYQCEVATTVGMIWNNCTLPYDASCGLISMESAGEFRLHMNLHSSSIDTTRALQSIEVMALHLSLLCFRSHFVWTSMMQEL